ncbi:hypothetical protein ACFL4T_08220 [candidate division KSB1 bacterium]
MSNKITILLFISIMVFASQSAAQFRHGFEINVGHVILPKFSEGTQIGISYKAKISTKPIYLYTQFSYCSFIKSYKRISNWLIDLQLYEEIGISEASFGLRFGEKIFIIPKISLLKIEDYSVRSSGFVYGFKIPFFKKFKINLYFTYSWFKDKIYTEYNHVQLNELGGIGASISFMNNEK